MVDNYLVRSLLGEAAFNAPVGAIGARPHLLRLAQQQLAQFDLIMLLEQVGRGCLVTCIPKVARIVVLVTTVLSEQCARN